MNSTVFAEWSSLALVLWLTDNCVNSSISFPNLTSKDLSLEDISSLLFPAISSKLDKESRLKNSAISMSFVIDYDNT